MRLFELAFRDWKRLSAFVKTCESTVTHSDTAMFKVKPKGVYVMLTDFESMCCVEVRLMDMTKTMLKMNSPEVSVKIMLDSFVAALRKVLKNKHSAIVYVEDDDPYTLQINEVVGQTNKLVEQHRIESAEHRPRVYHILSTNGFKQKSKSYVQFKIPNSEFNKIITTQCIGSGNCGGVGEISAIPSPSSVSPGAVKIRFSVRNSGGMATSLTIHTNLKALTIPLQNCPTSAVQMRYCLTYLKRSQNLFANPSDHVNVYISDLGMILQTEIKDNHSVVVFIADVSNEDMDSYA